MKNKVAFAFSGGGSRGALQVGAMYALLEYGLKPDLLIGASIGAANASYIALHGFSKDSLDSLSTAWRYAHKNNLLPPNYVWLTVRAMFGRSSSDPSRHVRDFFISNGVTPETRFSDVKDTQLVIVSADLNTGKPILHGMQPEDNVLEALLLSTALPPWFMPVQKQGQYLMDGGVVSNLPIESALKLGATGVVALDLIDPREMMGEVNGVRRFLDRLIFSVEKRQLDLELELAEARGIPVLYLGLTPENPVPLWDFQHTENLLTWGYEVARKVIKSQQLTNPILNLVKE